MAREGHAQGAPRALGARAGSRRAACIWLGTLASWSPGLVKRLVRGCGGAGKVLDHPPEELVALVAAEVAHRAAGSTRGAGGPAPAVRDSRRRGAEAATERERLEEVLRQDPLECARLAQTAVAGGRVVAWCDPLYPPGLRQVDDSPFCLFARAGCDAAELDRRLESLALLPAVAVVGTRAPSPYGGEMATLLGRDLTTRGALVVSGMAMGVDAMAQWAAVDAAGSRRQPATIGVLGCGADVVYPLANRRLFEAVCRHGLLLSEFTWGVPARAWRFPARNRVMAALARGVVVVEGAGRSGALLTAGYALEIGREVLAVPGEAGRRLSEAPHRLLRLGAGLCESAADVLDAIGPCLGPHAEADTEGRGGDGSPAHAPLHWADQGFGPVSSVLRLLEDGQMTVDELAQRTGLSVAAAAAAVSGLEVDGVVRLGEGGRYRLCRT